jgi:hypothetical protein
MRERRAPGPGTNDDDIEMIRAQPLTFALNAGANERCVRSTKVLE